MKKDVSFWAVMGLVTSIVSLAFVLWIPGIGLALSVLGIIYSVIGIIKSEKKGIAIAGIVIGVLALSFNIAGLVWFTLKSYASA